MNCLINQFFEKIDCLIALYLIINVYIIILIIMTTKLCSWCHMVNTMSDKTIYCTFCYENNTTYDWFNVFRQLVDQASLKDNIKSSQMCRQFSEVYTRMCTDELFEKLSSQMKKVSSYELAVSILQNAGVFFTAKQCKELVKNTYIDDNNRYKLHNLLVLACPEFYKLSVDDFTCGICYFGNHGDRFKSLSEYLTYFILEHSFLYNIP